MGEVLPFKLPPRRRIGEVRAEWEHWMNEANKNGWRTPCFDNPDPYDNYEVRPTPAEAAALCDRCPLLELHRELASVTKADQEVCGGVLWIKGKPVLEDDVDLKNVA